MNWEQGGIPPAVAATCREIGSDRWPGGHEGARKAVLAMADVYECHFSSVADLLDMTRTCAISLARARPELCAMTNAMCELYSRIEQAIAKAEEPRTTAQQVVMAYLGELERASVEAARHVGRVVGPEKVVLTLSHDSVLVDGLCRGRAARVIVAESRPGYEGRQTAARLAEAGLVVDLVSDAAAAAMVREAEVVLIGAVAVLADGAVVAKVGAYGVALAAREHRVQLFAAGQRLAISPIHSTPQEHEAGDGLWPAAPGGVRVVNPSYDLLPPDLVTGIVTERGMINAEEASRIAARKRSSRRALRLA